ncbi:IgA peptidase M64-domain-containing protein [Entophlyctis helioformis]|nr:IgA peptidase M64-domain-containing protein [Entophlyctis helioformis]
MVSSCVPAAAALWTLLVAQSGLVQAAPSVASFRAAQRPLLVVQSELDELDELNEQSVQPGQWPSSRAVHPAVSARLTAHVGTTLLLDTVTRVCTLTAPLGPVQFHRKVSPASPVVVEARDAAHEPDPRHRPSHGGSPAESDRERVHWVSLVGLSADAVELAMRRLCTGGVLADTASPAALSANGDDEPDPLAAGDKVFKIIENGPSANRIDVVFMGDGYTAAEADRFEQDIRRLVDDMWSGETFASVIPLFNIWAIFRPSVDSGIGTGGRPKNTAFGLYRDGTELRGIYTSKADAARRACRQLGKYACDYPSLIGNDEYYGGLGGEFVIATRSETSGTVVLRHEMGHNFVSVGEEYDGGQVYSGCNAAASLRNVPWKAWLTDPAHVREERSVNRVEDYAWYDLAKGPYEVKFDSDGKFSRWLLKISSSGVEVDGSLQVFLDGKPLAWNTTGTLDRTFFEWKSDTEGFTKGKHSLVFKQGFPPTAGGKAPIRQLCSITLHEFGDESQFKMDNTVVGMYPTWSLYGTKTYRPTNEGCLMRNMSSHSFCPVCKEGLWENLMTRISLIDDLVETCDTEKSELHLRLVPLPLAQFRAPGVAKVDGEKYHVVWRRDGRVLDEFKDAFEIVVPLGKRRRGQVYTVELVLETPQVRNDRNGVLRSKLEWVQTSRCG